MSIAPIERRTRARGAARRRRRRKPAGQQAPPSGGADGDDELPADEAFEAFGRTIGGKARPAGGTAVRSARSQRSAALAAAIARVAGGPTEQAAALQYTLESKLPAVDEALPLSSSSCPVRRARRSYGWIVTTTTSDRA